MSTRLTFLILAATSASLLSNAMPADETVRAEVQHAIATPDHSDDPNVAIFKLTFDLRLTNRSSIPVNIPETATSGSEKTRFFIEAMQSRSADGPWTNVFQASWYGIGTEKYDSCAPVAPAATAQIDGIASGLVLLEKQVASLGTEPTVRFFLLIFCRQPDGQVVYITVPTQAFSLQLPARPR